MYLLIAFFVVACGQNMMAMEFDQSEHAAQKLAFRESIVKAARDKWIEAAKKDVSNTWTGPDNAPAWFEAPALAKVMKSEQPSDLDAYVICQNVFDMFTRLQQAGRTFLEIRQLCSTDAASILYPDLKSAYDEFVSRKDEMLPHTACQFLNDVVTQATKQELVSLKNRDDVLNYITKFENQAAQIIADTATVEKELTQKNIRYSSYQERMEMHEKQVTALKKKTTWDVQDCLKICSLQQESEQLKKQLEFKKGQLDTHKQRQAAVEEFDRAMAPIRFRRSVIETALGCVAVGICVAQIISMRNKYKDDKDDKEVRAH